MKNPLFPTILTHRHRSPPFENPISQGEIKGVRCEWRFVKDPFNCFGATDVRFWPVRMAVR